jgi:RHS repeat-associated protein
MPMPNRQIVGGEPYRYAFQGQEKDPETGKEAFQLRLWDGRIGRWLTIDPKGEFSSPYLGMGNNPISKIDPDGGCTECPDNGKVGDVFQHSEYGSLTYTENGGWGNDTYGSILNDITIGGGGGLGSIKNIANASILAGGITYAAGSEKFLKEIDYKNIKGTPKGKFPAYHKNELVFWKDGFKGNKTISYNEVIEAKSNYAKNLKIGKNLTRIGNGVTAIGYLFTVYDYGEKVYDGTVTAEDTAWFGTDTVMTAVAFVPGVGWVISGVYFIGRSGVFSIDYVGKPLTPLQSKMISIDNLRVNYGVHSIKIKN